MEAIKKTTKLAIAARVTGDLADWFENLVQQSGKTQTEVLQHILECYRVLCTDFAHANKLCQAFNAPSSAPNPPDERIPQLKCDRSQQTTQSSTRKGQGRSLEEQEAIKTAAYQDRLNRKIESEKVIAALKEKGALEKRKRQQYRGSRTSGSGIETYVDMWNIEGD